MFIGYTGISKHITLGLHQLYKRSVVLPWSSRQVLVHYTTSSRVQIPAQLGI